MKKIFSIIFGALLVTGCIKNKDVIMDKTVAEFDATTWNAAASGVNYPILVRLAPFGRPILTSGPNVNNTITRTTGSLQLRVNLVGPTSKEQRTVGYQLFNLPASFTSVAFPATPTGQTPALAAATLTLIPAVEGVHYNTINKKSITIPADSTWGYLNIQILNPGATAGRAAAFGVRLDSTGTVLPSPNYSEIAVAIDQR
jgi:hypothetical protein